MRNLRRKNEQTLVLRTEKIFRKIVQRVEDILLHCGSVLNFRNDSPPDLWLK